MCIRDSTLDDVVPGAFSFTDVTGVALNTVTESDPITITSITAPVACSVTGGEYSKNGGAYTAAAGTVDLNDTIKVRGTSSSSPGTTTNVVFQAGSVSDT